MPRYFFDTRDGNTLVRDDVGVVLASIEAAHHQATAGLADLARDVLAGSVTRELAIEVRGEDHKPVLRASLWKPSGCGNRLYDVGWLDLAHSPGRSR